MTYYCLRKYLRLFLVIKYNFFTVNTASELTSQQTATIAMNIGLFIEGWKF